MAEGEELDFLLLLRDSFPLEDAVNRTSKRQKGPRFVLLTRFLMTSPDTLLQRVEHHLSQYTSDKWTRRANYVAPAESINYGRNLFDSPDT